MHLPDTPARRPSFAYWHHPAGDREVETLAAIEDISSDVAATILEHIVDCKVSNSRTVNPTDPFLLEPVA